MENKMTYIKQGIGIVEYDFELDHNSYNVGYTYEDYLNGAWVILTSEHLEFRKNNPSCLLEEMFDLKLIPSIPEENTLNEVKARKIKEIDKHDQSSKVNSFRLNGNEVWLDKSMRVGLMNSMQIEKSAGREESTLWFNDDCYTVPIDVAIQMLQQLELYALACYNKTAEHKVVINTLEDIESVEAYDYTEGYPSKLSFNIYE